MEKKPYITSKTIAAKKALWLDKIASVNRCRAEIDIEKSALLVIDLQEYFLSPESHAFLPAAPAILYQVKRLLEAFRIAGTTVVFTIHAHQSYNDDAESMGFWWKTLCTANSSGCRIHDTVAPMPGEKIIYKNRYSAFFKTDLEIYLKSRMVRDIVITGVMTNLCCESTARDAFFRNFRVFFPADCTATKTEEMHMASLLNLAYGFAFVTDSEWILSRFQSVRK